MDYDADLLRFRDTSEGAVEYVDIFHEVGTQPSNLLVTKEFSVDPSFLPVKIRVNSRVVDSRTRLGSPEYLASLRRKRMSTITAQIEKLDRHSASNDFVVWTHEILNSTRELLHTLTDSSSPSGKQVEGNACEILRTLRDTLMNGGWECYRDAGVRKAIIAALKPLTSADEVSEQHIENMDEVVDKLGLATIISFLPGALAEQTKNVQATQAPN